MKYFHKSSSLLNRNNSNSTNKKSFRKASVVFPEVCYSFLERRENMGHALLKGGVYGDEIRLQI